MPRHLSFLLKIKIKILSLPPPFSLWPLKRVYIPCSPVRERERDREKKGGEREKEAGVERERGRGREKEAGGERVACSRISLSLSLFLSLSLSLSDWCLLARTLSVPHSVSQSACVIIILIVMFMCCTKCCSVIDSIYSGQLIFSYSQSPPP